MNEIVNLLVEIRDLLTKMNDKLDDIQGTGYNSSISDVYEKLDNVYDKLDEIKGSSYRGSVSDVCDRLDKLNDTIYFKH